MRLAMETKSTSTWFALRNPVFSRLWLASVLSGTFVSAQDMAATWLMHGLALPRLRSLSWQPRPPVAVLSVYATGRRCCGHHEPAHFDRKCCALAGSLLSAPCSWGVDRNDRHQHWSISPDAADSNPIVHYYLSSQECVFPNNLGFIGRTFSNTSSLSRRSLAAAASSSAS